MTPASLSFVAFTNIMNFMSISLCQVTTSGRPGVGQGRLR